MMDYGTFREDEKNQQDLSILLGVNPLPVPTIPETIAKFKKKFQLRSEIVKSLPEWERDEIYRIVSLDRAWLKEVLIAETLQDLMERVRTVYERVLPGQIQYERSLEKGKFISIRRFEWNDQSPLLLEVWDNRWWIYCESALKKWE